MKKLILIMTIIFALSACKKDASETADNKLHVEFSGYSVGSTHSILLIDQTNKVLLSHSSQPGNSTYDIDVHVGDVITGTEKTSGTGTITIKYQGKNKYGKGYTNSTSGDAAISFTVN